MSLSGKEGSRLTSIRSRRELLKAAGGVGLMSLAAGCSGDGDGSDEGTSQPPADDSDDDADDATTPTPASGAQTGGTLRLAITQDVDTVHPHKAPGSGIDLVENMCNSLYRATADGDFVPDLAASPPEISDDGLTYTVPIREGVRFQEPYDREVTAEDVVANWRRILSADYGAYGRGYYVNTLIGEGIDPEMTVQQTGEYEVTFNLQQVYGPFIAKQARLSGFGWFSIIPMEALDEHGEDFGTLSTGAWGTGPFVYNAEASTPGSEYVLDRNPNYFRTDENGNQLPYLDRIVFVIAPEDSVRSTQLQGGDIQLDGAVPPTRISTYEERDDIVVDSTVSSSQIRMWLNLHTFEPTANKRVRQAMMYGMNRQSIVDIYFQGYASVAHSMFPPYHWAYDEESCTVFDHDPERAQSILAEEGYSDGLELECNPTNRTAYVDSATIIQNNLAQVGIDMEVTPLESSAMWDKFAYATPESDFNAAIGSFVWSWSADDFTYSEFHSDAAFNYAWYSNEEADELMAQARHTARREERAELYSEVQSVITDDVPMSFLVFEDLIWAWDNRVQNVTLVPTAYLWMEEVWMES